MSLQREKWYINKKNSVNNGLKRDNWSKNENNGLKKRRNNGLKTKKVKVRNILKDLYGKLSLICPTMNYVKK